MNAEPVLFDAGPSDISVAWKRIAETSEQVRDDFMAEFAARKPGSRQSWQVVPANLLQSVWTSFADLGYVWNRTSLEWIRDLVVLNILKLDFNTEVMDHKAWSGWESWEDDWESYGITEKQYDEDIPDFVCDEEGSWRISDCALEKLLPLAAEMMRPGQTPEELIALLDKALNICHSRSDLASWFVAGGSLTLTNLHDA